MNQEFQPNKYNVTQNSGKDMIILFRIQKRTVRFKRAGYSECKHEIGYLPHKTGMFKHLQIFAQAAHAAEQVEKLQSAT